ncbi:RNA polymerase sigma factor [Thioalkalivibrio sp. XN279]|uniref:RNA polymerase sigma factor n=1 Tax=Thioalkalivibrio sp. XN279 TaxID=2714953 RepID=UPI00140A4A78|nr:RNA polymerase sigma factor [Thioalkalivibrio sp. XN279]NHA14606.1 RNA polymerase sigma factor [Thioalkalivibrio sp. XN279]
MTDSEIIAALCRGKREQQLAIKNLYEQYASRMLRYFVHHGVSGEDAQDLLQETILKIYRSASGYTEQGTARAWIWTIARNCLYDYHRHRAGRFEQAGDQVSDDVASQPDRLELRPESLTESDELRDCVANGLEYFGRVWPESAYALTLWVEGYTMSDISEQIGRTVRATTEYLSQCRRKLKDFLQPCLSLLTDPV